MFYLGRAFVEVLIARFARFNLLSFLAFGALDNKVMFCRMHGVYRHACTRPDI
jgi:hypothetical protein